MFFKSIPVLYAFLVLSGFTTLFSYYKDFNVEIYSYLKLSEVLLSFLTMINHFLVAGGIGLFLLLILAVDRSYVGYKVKYSILILCSAVTLYYSKLHFLDGYFQSHHFWAHFVHDFYLAMLFFMMVDMAFGDSKNRRPAAIFLFIVLFIAFSWVQGEADALKTKTHLDHRLNVQFIFLTDTVATNDSTIYIGSSYDYLFTHDLKTNRTHVYSKSSIRNLVLFD